MGNDGIFLVLSNAGFISSTVSALGTSAQMARSEDGAADLSRET